MKLSDLPVLLLDCQTTGAAPTKGRLLEIAWLTGDARSFEVGRPLAPRARVIRLPEGEDVPRRILAMTGLGEEDLALAVPAAEAFAELAAETRAGPAIAIAHFAQFERPFVEDFFLSHGETFPLPWLCTHRIAKKLLPNVPAKGVRGVAGYFGARVREEVKRAGCHVEATARIWQGLACELERQGVTSLEGAQEWLAQKPAPRSKAKARSRGYEYPMDRNKRLAFPDRPGVYRMLAKDGEVLYVGKATSLKDRVNSYFRGRKGRDPRKLEMLTLAWDVRETVCETPLEAALLENDEIKRWDPPYNVSLKTRSRMLWFCSRDLRSWTNDPSPAAPLGPFGRRDELDSLLAVADACATGSFPADLFWIPIDPEVLRAGFDLYCAGIGLAPDRFQEPRSLLAQGLREWRTWLATAGEDESESEDVGDVEDEQASEDAAAAAADEFSDASADGDGHVQEAVPATPEELAPKYARLLRRAGRSYALARAATRMLDAEVEFSDLGVERRIAFRRGQTSSPEASTARAPRANAPFSARWSGLGVADFDRMKIALSELGRIARAEEPAQTRPAVLWPGLRPFGEGVRSEAP